MSFTIWYLVLGAVLITMALAGSFVKRLPLTSAMFYMAVGWLLGPAGLALVHLDPVRDAHLLERLTEVAVIVSLFTAGLKLRLPLHHPAWRSAIALAGVAMVLSVAAVALAGVAGLGLGVGAAVLLAAVLAPTDPVLASDVQVEHAGDEDPVRVAVTGEAGLNDGTAFPFVMLGLGLAGLHDPGWSAWRWVVVDLVWAVAAGLAVGVACGTGVARLVLYLRRTHREALGLDDFLALGLIATSYGLALLIQAYGFLAVFAAGLALRRVERTHSRGIPVDVSTPAVDEPAAAERATDPATAPAYMAGAVLAFNQQLERLGEVGVVLAVGVMLATVTWEQSALWLVPLLFLVVRPAAVGLTLWRSRFSVRERLAIGWFGVRGIGSVYYLAFAIAQGLDEPAARQLADVTLAVVAASVIVHGVSVTPLMKRYQQEVGDRSRQ